MARVKKQVIQLLSGLSARDIRQLQSKLVAPRLKALRREKAAIEKRLRMIGRQIAGLVSLAPRKGRKLRKTKQLKRAKRVRPARKGTIASRIKGILQRTVAPMRVKEICSALIRAGMPKKKGLVNYVNRILSTNPTFAKAGWGLYCIAGKAPAPTAKKSLRKKTEAPVAPK